MTLHLDSEAAKFVKLTPQIVASIHECIQHDFSPEQVSGFFAQTQNLRMSHEMIYQHILNDNTAICGISIKNVRNATVPMIVAAGYQAVSASMSGWPS